MFEDEFADSKCKYYVDPSLFVLARDKSCDKHTNNQKTLHSMTECALVISVTSVNEPGQKGQKRGRKGEHAPLIPNTKIFNEAFRKKYGAENGISTNIVTMRPVASRARLTDPTGKKIRKNAEKSMEICEWWLDLVTKENDVVCDPFAGTSSMGVACTKLKRRYQGCEISDDVFYPAQRRLATMHHIFQRGDLNEFLAKKKPGLTPSTLCQVCDHIFFSVIIYGKASRKSIYIRKQEKNKNFFFCVFCTYYVPVF